MKSGEGPILTKGRVSGEAEGDLGVARISGFVIFLFPALWEGVGRAWGVASLTEKTRGLDGRA
ncbi:MAG: hypothetical protein QOD75_3732, partial [Blastocatellia bacterium]|nr:hypothetical protein [Blastocatellia bacterium]